MVLARGHKRLENTGMYAQLLDFEGDEWHAAHARSLEEEDRSTEADLGHMRYGDKDEVAIYRKRK